MECIFDSLVLLTWTRLMRYKKGYGINALMFAHYKVQFSLISLGYIILETKRNDI